jgi:hypothetical protein
MKYLIFIFVILTTVACQNNPRQPEQGKTEKVLPATGNFGQEVLRDNAIPADRITALFTDADSVETTVFGKISASCKHSGCWMDLDLGNNKSVHVTFLDESFTIPLDAAGKNAVAQGIAVRELIPVEKLQNYAREEGKSEEEIAAITEPVYAYEFIASGVLIEE